ncbi:hypothetical protein CC78DRAFT_531532, partial [Lojkania enalia]
LLIASSSVRCTSAWSELATVFETQICDSLAYTLIPTLPFCTNASIYISTCPG